MNLMETEQIKFDSRWRKRGECHIWQGAVDRDGYGMHYFRGRTRRAHRVAWYSMNGEIPEGLVINHSCRTRACVNPQHLNLVTPRENSLRDSTSVGYINSQKQTCPQGHPYKTVTWAGKTQRVCAECSRERSRKNKRAAYERSKNLKV